MRNQKAGDGGRFARWPVGMWRDGTWDEAIAHYCAVPLPRHFCGYRALFAADNRKWPSEYWAVHTRPRIVFRTNRSSCLNKQMSGSNSRPRHERTLLQEVVVVVGSSALSMKTRIISCHPVAAFLSCPEPCSFFLHRVQCVVSLYDILLQRYL